MKLPRPYIPRKVRVQVAERQVREIGGWLAVGVKPLLRRLDALLNELSGDLCGSEPLELHHRPALCNRVWNGLHYHPDANDPEYLIYLPADEHDIETRVRGQHGDYSDLAKARKRKRKERKAKHPKFKWPKRKFQKG